MRELDRKKQIASEEKVEVVLSENKMNYLERKEMSKQISKLERAVAKSEEMIAEYEEKIEEIEALLTDPKNQDQDTFKVYDEAKKNLEDEMTNWETKNEELEALILEKGE